MKKPEKKELLDGLPDHSLCNLEGYNQALDDVDAWLELSQCPHCLCMTKTVLRCGKCGEIV